MIYSIVCTILLSNTLYFVFGKNNKRLDLGTKKRGLQREPGLQTDFPVVFGLINRVE
jgi:hypothetical protein